MALTAAMSICGIIGYLHATTSHTLIFLRIPSILFGRGSMAQIEAPFGLLTYQILLLSSILSLLGSARVLLKPPPQAQKIGRATGIAAIMLAALNIALLFLLKEKFLAVPPSFVIFLFGFLFLAGIGYLTIRIVSNFPNTQSED